MIKQIEKLEEELNNFFKEKLKIRQIKECEYPLLDEFLYKAIYIPKDEVAPPKNVTKLPELQVYIKDFGKSKNDIGFIAEFNKKVIGMIWARVMNDYGHIDNKTPSLAMSVDKKFQNKGIGTILLRKILEDLKEKNYEKVSLSVQKENYAVKLYKKLGFKVFKETSEEFIMLLEL